MAILVAAAVAAGNKEASTAELGLATRLTVVIPAALPIMAVPIAAAATAVSADVGLLILVEESIVVSIATADGLA